MPAAANVLLLAVGDSTESLNARVDARVDSCPGVTPEGDFAFYTLIPERPTDGSDYFAVTSPPNGASRATLDLDQDGVLERFRSCASTEGLHLTAWSGPVLSGLRRWHYYHYVGYDMEPTCTEQDYGTL